MRAITCTQCGATIEHVSETSAIVECSYCCARILLPERPAHLIEEVPAPTFESEPIGRKPQAYIVAAIALLIPIVSFVIIIGTAAKNQSKAGLKAPTPTYTPAAYPTPTPYVTVAPLPPAPVVNYQPRIEWDGPNDLMHFESPSVDISEVAHLTSDEIKKTVFKDRKVKLRVMINTEGEIDDIEVISGHPILVKAAVDSAKLTIFRPRSKPTKRVVTYIFRVLED